MTSLRNRRDESVIITDMLSLQQLVARPASIWRRSKILLQLDTLKVTERERWQQQINSHSSACGCKAGTIVMAIAIESYVLLLSLSTDGVWEFTWLHLAIGGLIGLLGAFVGKMLGLGWARYQLKKTVERLALHLAETAPHLESNT